MKHLRRLGKGLLAVSLLGGILVALQHTPWWVLLIIGGVGAAYMIGAAIEEK
jgi:4-hydroxybenzoate polyprenyltransferase